MGSGRDASLVTIRMPDLSGCPTFRATRCFVSGPVIVNNPEGGNNNGLLLGVVLTVVVIGAVLWFLFNGGLGGNGNGNGNGNGGDGNGAVPTIALPEGT
jgi:hypothetical protein